MSDTLDTLGTILPKDYPIERDAVHVAVLVVEAGETLHANDPVEYKEGVAYKFKSWNTEKAIGNVDPFLNDAVSKGEKFWLFLKPKSITSLKHEWDHPEIPADARVRRKTEAQITQEKEEAELWLKNWADGQRADWDEVLAEIKSELIIHKNNTATIDCVTYGTGNTDLPNDPKEFWEKVSLVVGVEIVSAPNYFSCSC